MLLSTHTHSHVHMQHTLRRISTELVCTYEVPPVRRRPHSSEMSPQAATEQRHRQLVVVVVLSLQARGREL